MGTLEVLAEALPSEWEVAMSRSKNMPYYYNAQTQKVYWVDDELPRGWSHQFDRDGRRFYFHVRDKSGTITYDKPVLRAASPHALPFDPIDDSNSSNDTVTSPEPVPVPAPSYDKSESPYPPEVLHDYGRPEAGAPPVLERKKSNSLMDLLSPAPPALGDDDNDDNEEEEEEAEEKRQRGREPVLDARRGCRTDVALRRLTAVAID